MAQTNKNMHTAKREKNDEFYTLLSDIEKELRYYKEQFKDKVVYCNCDDARQSNFFKYFSMNFEFLGLKKLISTSFNANGKGTILIYEGDINGNRKVDDEEIQVTELNGNGDFRSEECIELLKQADIVVTNPPFSLFREYVTQLVQYDKKFLIIGNNNAITYKEFFPYIIQGKVWLGKTLFTGQMPFFIIPKHFEVTNDRMVEENGKRLKQVNGVCWFTNLENYKQNNPISLIKTYNESEYPKYDNYNAINVNKTKDIPYDYEGCIGVPITALKYLCSDGLLHFEVPMRERERMCTESSVLPIMEATANTTCSNQQSIRISSSNESSYNVYKIVGNEYTLDIEKGRGYVNGKRMYSRIFIQKIN